MMGGYGGSQFGWLFMLPMCLFPLGFLAQFRFSGPVAQRLVAGSISPIAEESVPPA